MLQIPPTNLLLLAAKQEPYEKAHFLTKNIEEFSGKKVRGMDKQAEKKRKNRKSNGTRQKNKRGDSKVESNDSSEIPDRGRHQTSPASLRGLTKDKSASLCVCV